MSSLDAFLVLAQLTSPFPRALCAAPRPPDWHIEDEVRYLKIRSPICETKETHLVVVHPPQLDLPVIGPADDQRHAWVEIGPVHSPGGKHL